MRVSRSATLSVPSGMGSWPQRIWLARKRKEDGPGRRWFGKFALQRGRGYLGRWKNSIVVIGDARWFRGRGTMRSRKVMAMFGESLLIWDICPTGKRDVVPNGLSWHSRDFMIGLPWFASMLAGQPGYRISYPEWPMYKGRLAFGSISAK